VVILNFLHAFSGDATCLFLYKEREKITLLSKKHMMKTVYYIVLFLLPHSVFCQSNFDTAVKAGEVIVAGLSIFKLTKSDPRKNSKFIERVCVKNRLPDKIIFSVVGQTEQGDKIKKELVIQSDTKECFLELPKGIYTYEVILPNKEIYKKGDYKFDDDVIIVVRKED
jgi:hypothetical protein